MAIERVLVAEPNGFCAGVEMAIKSLAWMVKLNSTGETVYCYHQIVHNAYIVKLFERRGVVFVNSLEEVPDGALLMLSPHGSPPELVEAARARCRVVVDTACPLVAKVHSEAKLLSGKGYTIVYIGHEGHDEAVGTMAVAPNATHLVQSVQDVEHLPEITTQVALLTQTTLARSEHEPIRDAVLNRFGEQVWEPKSADMCYATTNRQEAVMAIAAEVDVMLVIGSPNSANTMALAHMAEVAGCKRVERIEGIEELPSDLSGVVGVTAGASAAPDRIQAVIDALDPDGSRTEVRTLLTEEEHFRLPAELRAMLPQEAVAADRGTSAAKMLAAL